MSLPLDHPTRQVMREVEMEMCRQGKSPKELAQLLRVSPATARRRLRGDTDIKVSDLMLTGRWLGVLASELVERAVVAPCGNHSDNCADRSFW